METVTNFIFLGSKITADDDCSHEIKRCLLFGRKIMTNIKKQRHYFADKGPSSQSYGYKESLALKNWCFWTVVLEKTLNSPLDCKEIQPVRPKGDRSWVFIGRTDAEAETPILWPPDGKSWLIRKDPNAVRDWGQEKGTTEDEIASWTQWTWVWVNSGSWWWTGRPGVMWFMGSQRVRHDWATEQNWTELNWNEDIN